MSEAVRIELNIQGAELSKRTAILRTHVPAIADEAAAEIIRQTPEYARPHDPHYAEMIRHATFWVLDHFMALMGDPTLPSGDLLRFYRDIGYGEAREGRSLFPLADSLRIGAGVALLRLTEVADTLGMDASSHTMAQIAEATLTYHRYLMAVAAEGHAEASAIAGNRFDLGKRRLVDLLISDDPDPDKIETLARELRWPVPAKIAAVALTKLPGRVFPPDILTGYHLEAPYLFVPDPEGPGRRAALEEMLADVHCAVGVEVAPAQTAKSMRWSRQALTLIDNRVLPGVGPVFAGDHLALLMLMQDPDLAAHAIARRLRPLFETREATRLDLALTLNACLEHRFNATEVGRRLHLHPQTVRYRIRNLRVLFGDQLDDPALHLELHMLLTLWLTGQRAEETPRSGE
ncbi:PucR family transcriptional regulator [Actinocorallia lasiicapitis]